MTWPAVPDWLAGPVLGDWPVGLLGAVLAALLLWPVGARLGLAAEARASAIAGYATAAVLVEVYAPGGVDGRATLLLVAAAWLAVGRRSRNTLAAGLTAVAVAFAPVTAVGFLALLIGMLTGGALATRYPVRIRWALATGGGAAAIGLAATLVRADLPPALPPPVLGLLSLWTLLVVGLLWPRMRWLRPLGLALLTLLVCCWLPGPDADAVIVVAAIGGVLAAGLAEEYPGLVRRRAVPVGVTALALLATLLVPGDARTPPMSEAARLAAAPTLRAGPEGGPEGPAQVVVQPVAISIPALGVTGPLERLSADPATGELSAPADPSRAGWYAAGVVPGDAGPAVVGGHVDSRAGPGVFFGLRDLRPGDRIEITRSDGRAVRFAVTGVAAYPKAEFPTAAVYGPAPGPELRLVTCGGQFDRAARSYRDNIVVDAVIV